MNAVKAFLAGGVAGAVAKSIIAPLERIKIMFQVSRMPFSTAAVLRESRRTVAEEGFTALYRGNGAQVLRVYPYSGIQLMTYDQVSKAILAAHNRGLVAGAARDAGVAGRAASGVPASGGGTGSASRGATITKLTAPEKLLAGSIAGATSVVFTYPLDLLRARLAVAVAVDAPLPSLWTMLRTMVARGGVSSLYVGVTPTLIGILPYAGISYAVFETGKQKWRERTGDSEPPTWFRLVAGGIAGFAGQASTYPLDLVRRRMQTEGFTTMHAHHEHHGRHAHDARWEGRHVPGASPGGSSGVGGAAAGVAATAVSQATTTAAAARAATTPISAAASTVARAASMAVSMPARPTGMNETLRRVVATEGWRGLFKGLSMNLVKGPIGVGVSFTVYDLLKQAAHIH